LTSRAANVGGPAMWKDLCTAPRLAAQGDEGQIGIRYGRERSGKLTFLLNLNRKGCDIEEEREGRKGNESGFGEHDYNECRENEQMTAAPGQRVETVGKENW